MEKTKRNKKYGNTTRPLERGPRWPSVTSERGLTQNQKSILKNNAMERFLYNTQEQPDINDQCVFCAWWRRPGQCRAGHETGGQSRVTHAPERFAPAPTWSRSCINHFLDKTSTNMKQRLAKGEKESRDQVLPPPGNCLSSVQSPGLVSGGWKGSQLQGRSGRGCLKTALVL